MLEACDMEELLGCHVSVHDRRVTFDIPAESWQYRVPQSAGSANANLASFRARVLIVATQVYPKQDVPAQIRALSHKYLELGFHRHELLRALPSESQAFSVFCVSKSRQQAWEIFLHAISVSVVSWSRRW